MAQDTMIWDYEDDFTGKPMEIETPVTWSREQVMDAIDEETFVPRRLFDLLPPIIAGDIPVTPIDTGP